MHNCKLTTNSLTDLALNEIEPLQRERLLAELNECADCREEYAAIKDALRVSGQALRATRPSEHFWAGYHDRLAHRLQNQTLYPPVPELSGLARIWLGLSKLGTASVRVPVPVGAAVVVLLFAAGTLFAWNLRRETPVSPLQAPAIVTQTITVPVTQEKVVTRIVYVDKSRGRTRSGRGRVGDADVAKAASEVAQSNAEQSATNAISLIGFKPTDQVKLKIMKGSYRDE
jgi:anti-sigma factor RsiW